MAVLTCASIVGPLPLDNLTLKRFNDVLLEEQFL